MHGRYPLFVLFLDFPYFQEAFDDALTKEEGTVAAQAVASAWLTSVRRFSAKGSARQKKAAAKKNSPSKYGSGKKPSPAGAGDLDPDPLSFVAN